VSVATPAELLAALAAEPYRHDFYLALRRVEAAHPRLPRLGLARRPADEPVRLGQAADLSFAASALHAVRRDPRSPKPRIEVRFFGLFGPNGPLPLHLTSYARERSMHRGDDTFARFADLFHHRLLLLFYRAWAQAQPAVSLDRPAEDRFADYVGALAGVGGETSRGRDAAPDHARLAFAGALSRQVRSADGLQRLLGGFLRRPVRVESFVGRWMALPAAERTRIGGRGARRRQSVARLGESAVLGQAVFDRQHHCRIHIELADAAALNALLPSGKAWPAVQALVRQYLGDEFGWDLQLRLPAAKAGPARLGQTGRLGWTSWAGQPRGTGAVTLTLMPPALAG
jgi:type VI secretion system protein ImpH